jgi:hypothetical protein
MSSDSRGSKARLAVAFIGGPTLALGMQALAYAEVPWACTTGRMAWVHLVPAIFVALTLVVVATAWTSWSRVGRHGEAEGDNIPDRTRFVALSALLLSLGSLLVILAMWIPLFLFDPCAR